MELEVHRLTLDIKETLSTYFLTRLRPLLMMDLRLNAHIQLELETTHLLQLQREERRQHKTNFNLLFLKMSSLFARVKAVLLRKLKRTRLRLLVKLLLKSLLLRKVINQLLQFRLKTKTLYLRVLILLKKCLRKEPYIPSITISKSL